MRSPSVLSVPASDDATNEDAFAVGDGVVVVVDGAGLPAELRAGCTHEVAWFARSVAAAFHARLTGRATSMRGALAETIAEVADSHRRTCDLEAGSPSATVAAWRAGGDHVDHLDYLVLCDASLVLVDAGGVATEVADRRLAEVLDAATPTREGRRAARRSALEAARNTPGGFWCVHHDPGAAMHAVVGRVPLAELSGVVACTDGGARAYDSLGTHSLSDFATAALHGDVAAIVAAVRRAETARAADSRARGLKAHDDLTIVAQPLRHARPGPAHPL